MHARNIFCRRLWRRVLSTSHPSVRDFRRPRNRSACLATCRKFSNRSEPSSPTRPKQQMNPSPPTWRAWSIADGKYWCSIRNWSSAVSINNHQPYESWLNGIFRDNGLFEVLVCDRPDRKDPWIGEGGQSVAERLFPNRHRERDRELVAHEKHDQCGDGERSGVARRVGQVQQKARLSIGALLQEDHRHGRGAG